MKSIALNDNTYWDATGVYDSTSHKTQRELNKQLADAQADTQAEITTLRAAVGSPLVADTVSGMTDTDKIYVYTGSESGYTNGNWYYHNGTNWVSGGVYNAIALSTDKTLTLENQAPDSKKVGDEISDLKSALSDTVTGLNSKANVIYSTASGTIVNVDDGADSSPIKKLVINIEPVQTSGTPNEETPLPITGWTSANVTAAGKNLLMAAIVSGGVGTNGSTTTNAKRARTQGYVSVFPNTTYTASINQDYIVSAIHYYTTAQKHITNYPTGTGSYRTFTTPSNAAYIKILYTKLDANASISNEEISLMNGMLEFGSTAHTYESYQGNTYPVAFPSEAGTVYAGQLIINNDGTGQLRVRPEYDTYNGEALVGPWISSMDVYEDGTTPTIGAQVVDLGGAETVYQLTEQPVINTLLGSNSIWADCGQVSAEYPIETKFYIDAVSNEIVKRDDTIDDVERKLVEYAGKGYLYWVTGTINSEGTCYFSGSTKYPVSNFVRISKIIRAYFSGDTVVRLYAYDSGGGYLGMVLENVSLSQSAYFGFSGELPIKEIKEKLPNIYYLRFACPSATRIEAHDNLHITIKTTEDERLLDNARWMGTSDQATPMPLTLLHISDIHGNSSVLHRINEKIDPYVNKINAKICTGDLMLNSSAGAEDFTNWWDPSYMVTIGNHDSTVIINNSHHWTDFGVTDRIRCYIEPFEDNWGIVRGEGQSYYYKDFASAKVRLIALDAMIYTSGGDAATAQNTWLGNTIDAATGLGYHVLIATHAPCTGATPFTCSFTNATRSAPYVGEANICLLPETVVNLVKNKIDNAGCIFIGYIVGHTHKDGIWRASEDPRQFFYMITCSTWSQTAGQAREVDRDSVNYMGSRSSWDYASGANYDAANLITIDTSRSLIKIIRVGGADIDMYMRRRKAICIRYSDGMLLGEI